MVRQQLSDLFAGGAAGPALRVGNGVVSIDVARSGLFSLLSFMGQWILTNGNGNNSSLFSALGGWHHVLMGNAKSSYPLRNGRGTKMGMKLSRLSFHWLRRCFNGREGGYFRKKTKTMTPETRLFMVILFKMNLYKVDGCCKTSFLSTPHTSHLHSHIYSSLLTPPSPSHPSSSYFHPLTNRHNGQNYHNIRYSACIGTHWQHICSPRRTS